MTSKIVDLYIWAAVGVVWFGLSTWALCTI